MKKIRLFIVPALFLTLFSCTTDEDHPAGISDASLSSMSGDDLVLVRTVDAGGSVWNIKMNESAARAYASNLAFPPNSMIVKEKLNADGAPSGYDIMYNAPADGNSHDGWLWTGLDEQRQLVFSSAERALSCQGCHSGLSKTIH